MIERGRRIIGSTWTLGILVFVLTWGGGIAELRAPNIDNSFHAGLQMAAGRGLDFGPEILVTYGPLGFLKSNLIFEAAPARLAGLYGIALHLSLSLSLVWAARRNFSAPIAFVVAFVAAMFARGDITLIAVRDDAAVVVIAFIWCVAALSERSPEWTRKLVVYGGGPYAAFELLTKLNTGLIVLAIVGVTVLAIDRNRWRNVAILAVGFAATATALWFATGQSLANVGTYLSGSLEVITGYSAGARVDYGQDERQYDYLFALLLFAVVGAALWFSTRRLEPKRRVGIALITATIVFTAAKSGFVSHEIFHMATFYGTMLGVLIAFPLPERPQVRYAALVAIAAGAAMSLTTHFVGYADTENPAYPMANPIANVGRAADTVAVLASGELEEEIEERRERLIEDYDLDPKSLRLLAGHTVHLDPSEAAAIWAHELDWEPLPIYQPYIAWTPELDLRNADALASAAGPERILRQDHNALGRFNGYESPAAMLEMLCNFEALRTTRDWQVLGRIPDRCREPRPLATVTTTFGEPVDVPEAPPDAVVFARVDGVQVSGVERLRTLLLRARGRQVVFSNNDRLWTLIAATAGDGLIMRAPPSVDFPGTFGLAPNANQVTFLYEGAAADKPIAVEFFAMRVQPRSS